jgi:hypothetical protein
VLGTPGNRVDVVAAVRQLVTKWLAEEQRAEAARTRQEGLFELRAIYRKLGDESRKQ